MGSKHFFYCGGANDGLFQGAHAAHHAERSKAPSGDRQAAALLAIMPKIRFVFSPAKAAACRPFFSACRAFAQTEILPRG